jgi:ubiquinone/menaquinone biosynthesis C-methylase UbiE
VLLAEDAVFGGSDEGTVMQEHRGHTPEERAYYALNSRVYATFARFYDVVVWPVKTLRRDLVQVSGARSHATVLDVATGPGAQAFAFAQCGARVVGIDLSDAMLRIAGRKNP